MNSSLNLPESSFPKISFLLFSFSFLFVAFPFPSLRISPSALVIARSEATKQSHPPNPPFYGFPLLPFGTPFGSRAQDGISTPKNLFSITEPTFRSGFTLLTTSRDSLPPNPVKPQKEPDRWIAWDKFWHFSASFVTVGAGYHLCANRLKWGRKPATAISIGGTFGLGLGKELFDLCGHHRGFSWKDIIADVLGITAGYFVFIH